MKKPKGDPAEAIRYQVDLLVGQRDAIFDAAEDVLRFFYIDPECGNLVATVPSRDGTWEEAEAAVLALTNEVRLARGLPPIKPTRKRRAETRQKRARQDRQLALALRVHDGQGTGEIAKAEKLSRTRVRELLLRHARDAAQDLAYAARWREATANFDRIKASRQEPIR